MDTQAKNLSLNIRALRLARGWTQHDLAAKLGCTQKTITAYECGTRHPTAEKMPAVAAVFGVSVNDLYGTAQAKKNGKAKSPKLWKKFEQIEQLPDADKRTVFRMVDAFLAQKKSQ